MIPGPDIKDGYAIRDIEPPLLRDYVYTHAHDVLSDQEMKCYPAVVIILQSKMDSSEHTLDISQMVNYLSTMGNAITEMLCRRMINKFEWDHIGNKYFEIVNGRKDWAGFDQIRASQVQAAYKSETA